MKRKVILTGDGSTTIQYVDLNEQYHSIHGAIAEAEHVYIQHGLHYLLKKQRLKELHLLEMGFGTGLNALLTLKEAEKCKVVIHYEGIEGYPLEKSITDQMNFSKILPIPEELFIAMHTLKWNKKQNITPFFSLYKNHILFENINNSNCFDLIYFDCFGARVQPELWTEIMFKKMYNALKNQGILVTYAAKGSVRRAMLETGFEIEKLKGPPGKREMLRGIKNEK